MTDMPRLDTALTIGLFGEMRVQRDGSSVVARLPGRQGRALLAYLVLNRFRAVDRDELLAVLWAERCPADPDAALGSVLAKVRRAVGPDLISGRGVLTLQLPAGADLDVQRVAEQTEQAERALASQDSTTALHAAQSVLQMLAQPLLPGLQGEWVESWRRHFCDLKPRALEASARGALALGGDHLAAAERAACAIVEIQPFRESAYALLMQVQAQRGDVAEAARTFERLRTLLRDELGTTPAPESVALHERLLREGGSAPSRANRPAEGIAQPGLLAPAPRVLGDGAFVGRETCLASLRKVWDKSRVGKTELVLLVGEPGIGKTRLAAQFAEEVHRAGGAALYGRADEDALLPHQPFVEALRPLLVAGTLRLSARQREILSRLIPDLRAEGAPAAGTDDDETVRYRLFEAVLEVLTQASRQWRVLLVLDDLHWADKPTLLLLRHLLREPDLGNLLVLGTFRDVEVGAGHPLSDVLADIRRERRFERMTIGGLEQAETQALVTQRLGTDVTAGFVRRLREQTEGNAFFIEETLRALEDADLPSPHTMTESSLERVGVPDGVAEVIMRRLRHLSPLGAELLVAASVIGREFRLDVVEQLVDAGPTELFAAMEECIVAGLIREQPSQVDVFTFSHAVVRKALYRQLTASRRVRLHHRVAEALESMGQREAVNPAELAHHFWLARHFAGNAPARRYSIAAAVRATKLLAWEEAAERYRVALELFDDDDEDSERCEVLLALGRVQWRAGDDAAPLTFLAAADSASRRGDAEQLARAAIGLGERWCEGDYVDARYRELLEEAVGALPAVDTALRALLLSRLAQQMGFPGERQRAISMSAEALAIARRLGDDNALTGALLARHVTLTDVRHLPERLALMEELASVRGEHRELAAEHHHWRLYDLFELGDLKAAEREYAKLEALAAELRQPLLSSIAAGWRGIRAELAGDVELAARCAEEGLRYGQDAHLQDARSTWAIKLFSARRHIDRVEQIMPLVVRLANGPGRGWGWPSALALLHLEAGDEAAARAIYERELARGPQSVPRGMSWLTTLALLSELCAKLGDVDRAGALYDALSPHAHRNVVVAYSCFWGPVESYLAYLADTRGDRRLASKHLRSALVRTRALGAPLLTAALEERDRDLAVA